MAKHNVPVSTAKANVMAGQMSLLKMSLQNLQSILKTFQVNVQANFDLDEEEFALTLLRLSYDQLDSAFKNIGSLEGMLVLAATTQQEGV